MDTSLIAFCIASFLLAITPGPSMLYIATRSLSQGKGAGIASVLGVYTGVLVHILAAILGLAALIAASAVVFNIVKYIGAAYLIYLGIRTLMSKSELHTVELSDQNRLTSIYFQGFLTNLFNPKSILFFLAFLPQFVDPTQGSTMLQIAFLGILFIVVNLPVDLAVALLASGVGQFIKTKSWFSKTQKWLTGVITYWLRIRRSFLRFKKNNLKFCLESSTLTL
ncbi:MAG: LysE family translocator [Trueperaceae bacterium]